MRIPVFVSCPTALNAQQNRARKLIMSQLDKLGLEDRAVGRSDSANENPLREVIVLAKHCSGGVILGFEQIFAKSCTAKRKTPQQKPLVNQSFPTSWNHLESGILYSMRLPLIVFRDPNVCGGVFDLGATDVFVHDMPMPPVTRAAREDLDSIFLKWQSRVREHYYSW
jgi:hypothetical protein